MNFYKNILAWYYSFFSISDADHSYKITMCVLPFAINSIFILLFIFESFGRKIESTYVPYVYVLGTVKVMILIFYFRKDRYDFERFIMKRSKQKFTIFEHLLFTALTVLPIITIGMIRS